MNKVKLFTITTLALALFGLMVAPRPAAADAGPAPVYLTFDKTQVDPAGIWEGSVGGDLSGGLTTVLTGLEINGPIWHVAFDWIIDTGDEYSFTAKMTGILNTNTGKVVMNGVVSDGWLEGAQVHEEGQLTNPATGQFQGTIRIMPPSAG